MSELRTPRRAVAAMFMLNGSLLGAWASRVPAFVEKFGVSERSLGLLLLCLALGAIVAFPFAGGLSDRLGADRLTRILGAAFTVLICLLPVAPTVGLLGLVLFLCGMTFGAMDVSMNAWAAEVERHLKKPIMSSFHALFSLGSGLGAGSGWIAAATGTGTLPHFLILAVIAGPLALWVAQVPWNSSRGASGPAFALPKGPLVLVGLFAFCSSLGEGSMVDWSAVLLQSVYGATEAQAALGYAAFSVTMVATRLAGDRITTALGPVNAGRICGSVAVVGALVVIFGGSLATALLGFALLGVGFAVVVPLAFSRAANDPFVPPGQAIAGVATLGYGGLLIGPPAIGFIAEATSLPTAFGLVAVLSVCIVLLAPTLRPPGEPAAGASAREA
ncbi:MFS transporter [Pelagovum pacificum]|uniref:MFS transporter n=1 Tax=Pelagovum pacificum TaxID=2588711 RepID=A0A5C5G9Q1_9RHOB|nr:MFS transporter [Pelagovum pacificum]QQA42393.1 MFS transporter [Pelagovum pacificum]TNY31475.1 MFS transporter [Pelagovum pacificum]